MEALRFKFETCLAQFLNSLGGGVGFAHRYAGILATKTKLESGYKKGFYSLVISYKVAKTDGSKTWDGGGVFATKELFILFFF